MRTLAKFTVKEQPYFAPEAMAIRPRHAALVAQTIATHSDIESLQAQMLVSLLGAKAAPAFAIFRTLTNAMARRNAVDQVVKATLSEQGDRDDLLRLSSVTRPLSKLRDEFAHGHWGYLDELPDALLWTDSRLAAQHTLQEQEQKRLRPAGSRLTMDDQIPTYLPTDVRVYGKSELEAIVRQLEQLANWYRHAVRALQRGESVHSALSQLPEFPT